MEYHYSDLIWLNTCFGRYRLVVWMTSNCFVFVEVISFGLQWGSFDTSRLAQYCSKYPRPYLQLSMMSLLTFVEVSMVAMYWPLKAKGFSICKIDVASYTFRVVSLIFKIRTLNRVVRGSILEYWCLTLWRQKNINNFKDKKRWWLKN